MNGRIASVERLNNLKISHRNWKSALSESFTLLTMASPGDVIAITGPSRAGKSRLISELSGLLVEPGSFEKHGHLPVVVVNAVNSGPNGTFSTKAFTLRMLDAVRHPTLSTGGSHFDIDPTAMKVHRATEASLRLALERAFRARKTRYLFIDEAQHAKYASKTAQGSYAILDSWKCLAHDAGLILVIVGAYPVLQILQKSPHLLGRKSQVHLPRYYATEADLREFGAIVATYLRALQLQDEFPAAMTHLEILYQGSFGCIGLLRKWLIEAVALSAARDVPVSIDLLREARPSKSDLEKIASEIREGEAYFSFDMEVGRDRAPSSRPSTSDSTAKKRVGKPFQKKPRRLKPENRTTGEKL